MTSRDRFEAHMAARTGCDSCSAMNTEAHWLTWQARDAEVTRLVDALREAMPYVEQHQSRLHGGLLIRIDALLRENRRV